MGAYHLWHPAYVSGEPLTLEALVTMGDALLEPRAGDVLDASARSVLGLPAGSGSTHLERVRTSYFSSYRDSPDWADRWALAWRWRVVLAAARREPLPEVQGWGWFDVEAAGALPEAPSPCPCLLVVDARTDAAARQASSTVERVSPEARVEHGQALGRVPQLRVDLGSRPVSWYESGADEAEAVLAALADLDVSVSASG